MDKALAERTRDALRSRGLRATRNRLAVAGIVAGSKGPLGVKDIFERLVRKDSRVGLATVYRVISALEEAGVIARAPSIGGTAKSYQAAAAAAGLGQVVCSRCGKVEEIAGFPGLDELRRSVVRQSNFATAEQSLYIIADCRNEECD